MPMEIPLQIVVKAWLVNELEVARFNCMFASHLCIFSGVLAIRGNAYCPKDHILLFKFSRTDITVGLSSPAWSEITALIMSTLRKEPLCRLRRQNPDLSPDE